MLIRLCLDFAKTIFSSIFLCSFKVNYPIKLEIIFCKFLVVTYMLFNFKPLKTVCVFCTKICDSIKNYVHYGKKKPRQEVGDGYIL